MEVQAANLLRPTLSVSPYPALSTSASSAAGLPTTSPQDSSRSPGRSAINGHWSSYGSPTDTSPVAVSHAAAVAAGATCNFSPYGSSLSAVSSGVPGAVPPHKPPTGYGAYPSSLATSTMSDFLPNCQQIMQNHQALTPLHTSLNPAGRNFPFYPGDVYQTANHHGGMPGSGLFPDLSIPSIPRFDADTAPVYTGLSNDPQNPGEHTFLSPPVLKTLHVTAKPIQRPNSVVTTTRISC